MNDIFFMLTIVGFYVFFKLFVYWLNKTERMFILYDEFDEMLNFQKKMAGVGDMTKKQVSRLCMSHIIFSLMLFVAWLGCGYYIINYIKGF